ncbi:MAG: multidrug efflux RND transporter permease subunit [Gallionellales bacterium RIFCSPLOWO2_12_FULL_59_22]|nr:MAG: multidrug efflux RND transporter permease subunit [Gallionellales bacterium RIFCSPLOWO2_02_FULL_59_110]OGT04122.1 MAG: multidrug efflux RND transporter permease subunit [Gallionellales bacterium RIFCSPLOWO2_02_58_13]OGT13112.1 MAG: multidrug efflux RND transporter permease subunit [Gallionellales bacterium RIFCSPLOWO2_12_FULL_59_22]
MFANFFIDRPIFAWVIAILITFAGILALRALPVSQYPSVAPPALDISVTYPGASAQVVEQSAVQLIEQEMNGIENLLYMDSNSQVGSGQVSLTFKPGTDIQFASVEAQNRIKRVEARLPDDVRRLGVTVTRAGRNFIMVVALTSPDGRLNVVDLGSYATASVLEPLLRVPGVGEVLLFGTEYSMRIWLKPDRMEAFSISPADVGRAVRAQNTLLPLGEVGQLPAAAGQEINAVLGSRGRLATPEEFGDIVVRASPDGSSVRLRDIARIELGAQDYNRSARLNGQPIAGMAIRITPGSNALATAQGVRAKMQELSRYFPQGVEWVVPYDTTRFIELSIREVMKTLLEAAALVLLVMFVFLGSWRTTLIPAIVVPVSLLGGMLGLYVFGFSINVLTLFAMVLAIGIVVDDAIVVVENVERNMRANHLDPHAATRQAMKEITGAIIAITLVLMAVFVPMAFFGGSTGAIYRQFAVTLVVTVAFSAFLALSLIPALCANLLKHDPASMERGFHGWFNRFFGRVTERYVGGAGYAARRLLRSLAIYAAIVGVAAWTYGKLPGSFLPEEDQGYLITAIQLPPAATRERAQAVLESVEQFYLKQPQVDKVIGVLGFSFFGRGQNMALAFVRLKDWDDRPGKENSVQSLIRRANMEFFRMKQAMLFAINPPPIPELASAGGFDFRLQDRGGVGRDKLLEARNQVLGMAMGDKRLAAVRPEGQEPAPQLFLDIDRDKAETLGIASADLNDTLQSLFGVSYINDFVRQGRVLRVQMQAEEATRKSEADLLRTAVRNNAGRMVRLSEFVNTRWVAGATKLDRYNGLAAMKISGAPAPGVSSGGALAAMEGIAQKLPPGIGFEWSGISSEEKLSGQQAPLLFGVSLLVVFLVLAALYESWSIPLAVMLAVPLGVFGALFAVELRDLPNDVYFKVGLIAIIGLAAKNAILIVEFARRLEDEGRERLEAVLEACRLRLRPILMTSITFIASVFPLAISTGAGAESRRAIGTGVIGGMFAATVLAIFLVPVFFMAVRRVFPGHARKHKEEQHD